MMLVLMALWACTRPNPSDHAGDSGGTTDTGTGDTGLGLPDSDPEAQVDVLVVGAGPAGLAAAVDARDAGASVLVVERESRVGGSAIWIGGFALFSGSSEQADAGIDDSPERLLEDWPAMTGGDPEDPWVRQFAERNVPDVHDWFVDMGVHFALTDQMDEGASVRRISTIDGGGNSLILAMQQQLDADEIELQTTVTDLVVAQGRVRGAWVAHANGETGWIEAGAVVVATGGFLRNLDLVREVDPSLASVDLWFSTSPGADGNGHEMLQALGGSWKHASTIGIYAHGVADPRADGEELTAGPLQQMIWVNTDGERFTDEGRTNSYSTAQDILAQPDGIAWAIYDDQTFPVLTINDPMVTPDEGDVPTPEDLLADGIIVEAETLDELAASIGVDASGLAESVAAYNDGLDAGSIDPYRGTVAPGPKIDTPPYYAMRIVPALAKGFGGIATDVNGRVIDADGNAIPGLYAAGELTGMAGGSLVGAKEDGGQGWTGSVSAVVLSGRVAGEGAAAEALDL